MTEETKKIVLPPYLLRRMEAFRIVKGDVQTYLLRDKLQGKTYDFDPWQFFILEILPGCDTLTRLQTAFQDRFDRAISKPELDEFLGSIADRQLFDESAAEHPLLAPFMRQTFEVEDGKAKPKLFNAAGTVPAAVAVAPGRTEPSFPTRAPPMELRRCRGWGSSRGAEMAAQL